MIVPVSGAGGMRSALRILGTTVAPIALLVTTLVRIF
jgi:hypothetical protein